MQMIPSYYHLSTSYQQEEIPLQLPNLIVDIGNINRVNSIKFLAILTGEMGKPH